MTLGSCEELRLSFKSESKKAAWTYRRRPNVGGKLRKRQEVDSEEAREIAWKVQHRLHTRYRKLTVRGKNKGKVVTAIGRELLGSSGPLR